MITLEGNRLKVRFPEILDEIKRLTLTEVDQITIRFLAEDRTQAFRSLTQRNYLFGNLTEAYERQVKETLLSLKPEVIKKAIKDFIGRSPYLQSDMEMKPMTTISFQRTLRIPDDSKTYPLPPSLGNFPLVHVDDHAQTVPSTWNRRGGVMMPMYQAEALWLSFQGDYPCALKVAAGKINAVTGKSWTSGLQQEPQDYLSLPDQPWLDGYCVKKGYIRQFVAMPLGDGYTAEEQISEEAEYGGLQLQVYPLKARVYFDDEVLPRFPRCLADILATILPFPESEFRVARCAAVPVSAVVRRKLSAGSPMAKACRLLDMGLGAGGEMRQEIHQDERPLSDYDLNTTSRCFIHLCNSLTWKSITGSTPPQPPILAQLYAQHGFPWFDVYRDDLVAVDGSEALAKLKTVSQIFTEKQNNDLPGNESAEVTKVIQYGEKRRPTEVREWPEDNDTVYGTI